MPHAAQVPGAAAQQLRVDRQRLEVSMLEWHCQCNRKAENFSEHSAACQRGVRDRCAQLGLRLTGLGPGAPAQAPAQAAAAPADDEDDVVFVQHVEVRRVQGNEAPVPAAVAVVHEAAAPGAQRIEAPAPVAVAVGQAAAPSVAQRNEAPAPAAGRGVRFASFKEVRFMPARAGARNEAPAPAAAARDEAPAAVPAAGAPSEAPVPGAGAMRDAEAAARRQEARENDPDYYLPINAARMAALRERAAANRARLRAIRNGPAEAAPAAIALLMQGLGLVHPPPRLVEVDGDEPAAAAPAGARLVAEDAIEEDVDEERRIDAPGQQHAVEAPAQERPVEARAYERAVAAPAPPPRYEELVPHNEAPVPAPVRAIAAPAVAVAHRAAAPGVQRNEALAVAVPAVARRIVAQPRPVAGRAQPHPGGRRRQVGPAQARPAAEANAQRNALAQAVRSVAQAQRDMAQAQRDLAQAQRHVRRRLD